MVWLLGGEEQNTARDAVADVIRRAWGTRVGYREREMAEEVVAGLYRQGYRVVRQDTQLVSVLSPEPARAVLVDMLTEAVEDSLTWETFKGSTDADLARMIVEWVLADESDYEIIIKEKHA